MSLGSCNMSRLNCGLDLANQNPWYVLGVKPKHEKRVAQALGTKGYEAFLPLFLARRRWLSASRDVNLPLFPHYVFCRMDPHHKLPILEIPSVRTILSFGRVPIPVGESEIQSIRTMVASGLSVTPHHFLGIGTRVRVTAGPLSGIDGILETIRGQDRIVVSVALLQRSVSVEIHRQDVMPSPKQVGSVGRPTERATTAFPTIPILQAIQKDQLRAETADHVESQAQKPNRQFPALGSGVRQTEVLLRESRRPQYFRRRPIGSLPPDGHGWTSVGRFPSCRA